MSEATIKTIADRLITEAGMDPLAARHTAQLWLAIKPENVTQWESLEFRLFRHSTQTDAEKAATLVIMQWVRNGMPEAPAAAGTFTTTNGIALVHGTQVLLRGITPAVVVANTQTGAVVGLWRPGPGITGTMERVCGAEIQRTSDETLATFQRYPLIAQEQRARAASGKPFETWEVRWWIESNPNQATHIDYDRLSASASEIYANS